MRSHVVRRTTAGLAALVLSASLVACTTATTTSDDTTPTADEPTARERASRSPAPAASPSPTEPAASPSPTESSPSPSPTEAAATSAPPRRLRFSDRLLAAQELPGLNEEWEWADLGTRQREGRRPFGTCHKFAMTSIGATRVVTRDYGPADGGPGTSASHMVAQFADAMTAKRAYEVLQSWRGDCEEELTRYDRVDVGALEPVDVARGDAGWYLLVYGPIQGSPDEAYFDAQGIALVGTRVAVLQMRLIGQDYNYRAGREPMVAAVRAAADRLS